MRGAFVFQFYVDKTLILNEKHCSVLNINEAVIVLSGKGRGSGFCGFGSFLALKT